ncbi:hypothetical protein IQ270_20370 [Microcoleus sp. LEGE 07076]|uniref:DUF6391 domain-containing protein n=1 Tax=Microcoleus sp. LEGE 07076 TaxID=915322 RepID=UPI0018821926|nr:DUF6391 domain-containing protein [Microcoleus sp. LEGE 07076]MBE9186948.1 hypothetical protein [Microcoleus sp. LEGE 07076]
MTTNAASAADRTNDFPFEFAPQPTQDADLLRQLDFVPGLKEILTLRQVHALEHATVWLLGQSGPATTRADNQLLGGMSTDQGFYLYGHVNIAQLRHAVGEALHRIASGEWDLAVHPRCGTNLSVAMLLTAGLAVGINLALPKGPVLQLLGLGAAAATAAQLAPDVGSLVQRYVTTAIPFNLSLVDISVSDDFWGREAHFVRVRWID